MRPIVSAINSPFYHLAKFLAKTLDKTTRTRPYHLQNSALLIQELKEKELASLKMSSYDVTALYPSIPLDELDNILHEHLQKNQWEKTEIQQFLSLIHLVNENNYRYFIFNNKIYHHSQGLAMRSPLAATLALIYMEYFESKIVPSIPEIKLWRRYVDDILTFTDEKICQNQSNLQRLNKVNPNIQFTLEEEQNESIPFLDCRITRKPNEGTLSLDVYRKPTFTGRHIDGQSNHSDTHEDAFLYSAIHRIFQFNLEKPEIIKELQYLKNSCKQNSIKPERVDKIFNKIRRKKELLSISSLTTTSPADIFLPGWLTLSYSKFHLRLAQTLRKQGVRTAFRCDNTTRRFILKIKDKIPDLLNSGVYKLYCGDCNNVYVGQTCRSFATRKAELLKYPAKSAFCEHLLLNDHDPNVADIKILKNTNNRQTLNVVESCEILKSIKNKDKSILKTVLGPCSGSLINWLHPPPKIFPIPGKKGTYLIC